MSLALIAGRGGVATLAVGRGKLGEDGEGKQE
jgi:hypothetical protein